MKLPHTEQPEKYVGLYVVDFGDHCAVGYTAEETATLLESEQFNDAKVYKIHRAHPDGRMEIQGVSRQRFLSESGMFFHSRNDAAARNDYRRLLDWNATQTPPCRAKLQIAGANGQAQLVALIYPAEFEHEIGEWLRDSGFRGDGAVDAGPSQVTRYYQAGFEILAREQLWPAASLLGRGREELLKAVGESFQR